MRKDMNKVVTERPRAGARGELRKVFDKKNQPRRELNRVEEEDEELRDEEFLLPRESMRRRYKVGEQSKNLTDHIKPLLRYLRSQAGRPWNDVWSDICQVLKGNGLQANHVKEHVKQYVDGIPHSGETYFRPEDWHQPRSFKEGVYVDEKGILRKSPSKKKWWKRDKEFYHYTRESDLVEYHKINGCWFRIELVEETSEYRSRFTGHLYYTKTHYIKNKQALSRKKSRKLGLEGHYETRPPRITP